MFEPKYRPSTSVNSLPNDPVPDNPIHMILSLVRAGFCRAVIVLSVCWIGASHSFAQQTDPSEAIQIERELLVLDTELDAKIAQAASLSAGLSRLRESDHAAMLYRRDQHSVDMMSHAIQMIEKLESLPADNPTHIAVRARLSQKFRRVDDLIIQRLAEIDERIVEASESAATLSGAAVFTRQAYIKSLYSIRNQVLETMVDVIPARESLGIHSGEFREQAELTLFHHAERLVALLELSTAASLELARQRGLTPSDPSFLYAQTELQNQHETELAQLISITEALERLDVDTTSYRATIVKQRGVLSADLFKKDILKNIALEYWESVRATLGARSADVILNTLVILLILFAALWLSRFARRATNAALQRLNTTVSKLHKDILVSTSGVVIMGLGVLLALGQMGISLGPMLAGLGIAGFIVGFALQDSLANFAAGGMILIYRPFDVDDYVEVAGEIGLVKKMSLVTTTIHTFDNQTLVIPNNKIWGSVIKNVTAQRTLRVDLVFGVSYDSDIEKVERILSEVVSQHPKVLSDPEPKIRVDSLGDSSVNFIVRPWATREDVWEVRWDLIRSVKIRFDAEGIVIPFPQRDVHVSYEGEPQDQITRVENRS